VRQHPAGQAQTYGVHFKPRRDASTPTASDNGRTASDRWRRSCGWFSSSLTCSKPRDAAGLHVGSVHMRPAPVRMLAVHHAFVCRTRRCCRRHRRSDKGLPLRSKVTMPITVWLACVEPQRASSTTGARGNFTGSASTMIASGTSSTFVSQNMVPLGTAVGLVLPVGMIRIPAARRHRQENGPAPRRSCSCPRY